MNLLKDYDTQGDKHAVKKRLKHAALVLYKAAWVSTLPDFALVIMWLFCALAPILGIMSSEKEHQSAVFMSTPPVGIAILFLATSATPLIVSTVRVVSVLKLRGTLSKMRVDHYAHAPNKIRQVAYVSENRPLGTWMYFGYLGPTLYTVINVAVCFFWTLVFGLNFVVVCIIVVGTLLSALSVIGSTIRLYAKGINDNFETNVAFGSRNANQWARACAYEALQKWDVHVY